MVPQRRLNQILNELKPNLLPVGTLKLGDITYDVPASFSPTRLARTVALLEPKDGVNLDNLHFMLQKYLLGQDIFLVSQPGPYARRLALTFASLINSEYEYIALHRDVGETELKQGREIRKGGNLVYVDSPAVSAVKHGRILILEGIEKAERGIMPVLNNLLENREMNLDDGTHIIHPHRYAQLEAAGTTKSDQGKVFIPAHKNFRVIAIAAPVPPYPGYPLDPPFRSRFQARFVDPVGALLSLDTPAQRAATSPSFYNKLRDLVLTTQYASESRHALEAISKTSLPPFPQTALSKLRALIQLFPPAPEISPSQLARLILTLHPVLIHSPFQAWAILGRHIQEAGLGELGSPSIASPEEHIGIFGYTLSGIKRIDDKTAQLSFEGPSSVKVDVSAGSQPLRPFPFTGKLDFQPSTRFTGLLTCFMQAHALGWDVSLIPPAILSSPSTSTSTLVRVFSELLGYDSEVLHMYKELGGRELLMRRKIEDGGATTWEPSPLVEAAWSGRLLHLSGLDVIGSTAGSLSRMFQDREAELWEGKRIVGSASLDEIQAGELSVAHPSFRIISTASKSLPLKDWLSDEHANMFFPIPSQPMDAQEELSILIATGSPQGWAVWVAINASIREATLNSVPENIKERAREMARQELQRRLEELDMSQSEARGYGQLLIATQAHMQSLHNLLEHLAAKEEERVWVKRQTDGELDDSRLTEGLTGEATVYKRRGMEKPELGRPQLKPKRIRFIFDLSGSIPRVEGDNLIFPPPSSSGEQTYPTIIPTFKPSEDPAGVSSRVPHMDHFYDNSLQTGLMRDLAIDLELLGEHVVLLGNQGIGSSTMADWRGAWKQFANWSQRKQTFIISFHQFNPSPRVEGDNLIFPPPSSSGEETYPTIIPVFKPSEDPAGKSSHVPHMDHFYDNSLQTGLMRDLAIDLELLGEHVVLLGNQGVGKNKIVDRLCQLLRRPREYIQLHRDTTVNQLMFTTSLESGIINYTDSPLLRAIKYGRFIIIDEADKAPEHVVAIFRSLAGQGELTLSDGRRVRLVKRREEDIVVHPNFRLILLANRPGYPFLGNHFLQVLGENFSAHSVSNPDPVSERNILSQLAPEMDPKLIQRLVAAFQDLRAGYDSGLLNYPYSLRELINLVRHMKAYPNDTLGESLRNIFDFDIYKPEAIDKLSEILVKHGLQVPHLGLDAAREAAKKVKDVEFEPTNKALDGPKEGKHDNEEHSGGDTYAGGTGGRSTAGMGGMGGYKRFYKGGDIKQVPDALKDSVPENIKERAREMARQELQRRLEELDMSQSEARGYGQLLIATQAHMQSLHNLLEHLAAKEEERVWVKRQTDGELDDSRLTEGLTGEATVYKRRGMEKPELGRPQLKPKRIRFIFDLSGSMYRFQYDGRLERSMETAVMLMETFDCLSRKEKYVWDIYGHSGDGPDIPLVEADKPPSELKDRWKVAEKIGIINYTDSPLLRAIKYGRFIIIDEADKAPEHVVAIFRSLAGQGELTLSDGRRVRLVKRREEDIVVHPNFRLILLANRPGYPFLGNHFLQVLGENFSAHSVSNPDPVSERNILSQLAPEMDPKLIQRLVAAFQDLRAGYDSGLLNYPYSLRELINLVRHMKAYPNDTLGESLRNIFDFDIYKPEAIDKLSEILVKHGLQVPHLGLDAAREAAKKVKDVEFEPTNKALDGPKEGKHDNEEHSGGDTYAGGTGGRSTAGMGGMGGYKRFYKGGDIKQVPDALKDSVPENIKERAREMARQELQRRLEELDMSQSEARGYGQLLIATQAHMQSLHNLLEHLAAKEEERVWVKRQTDGELDDSRLTEGLTGEATVYKRRGMEKPELGRPQLKPKRIRFIFDLSGSMYRFQYDGRLERSMETAVMLMETFDCLSRKEKYVWDIYGYSGDGPDIPLVEADKPPSELKDRWKVAEKMYMIPQYAFAGDFTVEAIVKGVTEVAKYDADDWFVIAITDANFSRYGITPEELTNAMKREPKVHTALICIGEGAEATCTAGMGGMGGYKRFYKGGDIKQVPDALKDSVPENIKERAREMARQELQRRLEELDMSQSEARGYGQLLIATQAHMQSLHNLLEHLAAKEEERVWVKRQTDGELDDSRLTEGLTGEATVYKRRGMEKPELGRPQLKWVPDALKDSVPENIKERAREMARQELQRRLEELDMSQSEARGYGQLLIATQAHMQSLHNLLEHLAAKEEERVWVKRQTDGELDDSRLTEGLTGEATVYKRRGMEKPELGRPQLKPKRIRFIFDLSGSMYRFQYDGRLERSMETAVMLMETFDCLSRKEKYVWDIYGHSGDGPDIPLVEADKPPSELKDRWKVAEKMYMIPQYAFAGDFTVEAIVKGVTEVAKYDADDWFVIAITDANFSRYGITPEELTNAMKREPKVHTALICIGEGAEATW
ncbi:von Willebrand factor A domain-containing protein 8 [Leucoagaricus sp. SymC.cos]|nr:von Willebrand factor A domain-containing protein 8 [Leucoagaricus sp. SymC.cos]